VSGQLRLPFERRRPDNRSASEFLLCAGQPVGLQFVRNARARRYVLRVGDDGAVRVTMPRWGRKGEARKFAESHTEWIGRQRAARLVAAGQAARRLEPGAAVLLRGVHHPVRFERSNGHTRIDLGDLTETGPADATLRGLLVHALRAAAQRSLVPRLLELAHAHGLQVTGVSIRNQRTRWGSCSSRGRISLNWRLVQMPPAVADYVLLHELMHLRVPNHSRRFWKQVALVCPDYEDARRWLREHGTMLLY
jgi:predicted metal-dependent hydrolase